MRHLSSSSDSSLATVAPAESRAAVVARELRDAILGGELKPGERIKQDAVAQRLGVSRLPVREALRELAGEGLVTLERDVGARVAPLDHAELIEVYLLRETIEPMMAAAAARRITEEEVAEIREIDGRSAPAVKTDDVPAYLDIDRDFHTAVLAAARMPRAMAVVQGLRQTAERYRWRYSSLISSLNRSAAEHEMLTDALERRAPEDASAIYRIHIRRTRTTLAAHPELFAPED